MGNYVVASDRINGQEQSYISTVISKLEAKGHTCENAGVGPNTIQSVGLKSSSSGKIGVFIVGGSDAGMYYDFVQGLSRGYYHYKYMWVVFASNTATTDKWITCNGLSNTKLVRAWDDNYSSGSIPAVGKTAKQYFSENKQYISYVCGEKGCTFDSIASKLANGGEDDEEEGSSASTIKDALKEVLYGWDGEVECRIVNNQVFIHKVPNPETAELYLIEGLNVLNDSVSITDVNPDTSNKLIVHWSGGSDIILTDDNLINRFGEKVLELEAVKKVYSTETEETTDDEGNTTTETKTVTEEVPINNYDEALEFAQVEWAKIKRDNGHTLEVKVMGSPKWEIGKWVKVILPSFNEDNYMYIIRVNQDETSNGYTSNLTLVDYPPGFGEYNEETNDDEDEDEDTEEEDST